MSLAKRVGLAAAATILSTLLVFLVLSFWPKTYESREVLHFPLVNRPSVGASPFAALSSEADSLAIMNLSGALLSPLVASSPRTATGILESRTCMSTVVETLGLAKEWDTSHDKAIKRLQGLVSVRTDDSGFLVISARGASPGQCVEIIEIMDEHLRLRAGELTLNVSKENREDIEERFNEALAEVDLLQDDYVASQQRFPITELSEIQNIYLETDQRLRDARIAYQSAQANIDQFETLVTNLLDNADSEDDKLRVLQVVQGDSTGTVANLAVELQNRRLQLDDIAKDFTEQSEEFRQARQRAQTARSVATETVDQAEENLEEGRFPTLIDAKAELSALGERVDLYADALAEYEEMARKSPGERIEVDRKKREFDEGLLRAARLRQELDLARIAETRDPSRFEVVDPPVEIGIPVAPRKALLSGLWFVGFGVLAGWWSLRENLTFLE